MKLKSKLYFTPAFLSAVLVLTGCATTSADTSTDDYQSTGANRVEPVAQPNDADIALASAVWGCTDGATGSKLYLESGRLWGAGLTNITPEEQTETTAQAIASYRNTSQAFANASVYDSYWADLKSVWEKAGNDLVTYWTPSRSLAEATSLAAGENFDEIEAYCNLAIDKATSKAYQIGRNLTDWVLIAGGHLLPGRNPGYPKGSIYDYGDTSIDKTSEIKTLLEQYQLPASVYGDLIGFNPGQYRVAIGLYKADDFNEVIRDIVGVLSMVPSGVTDINLVIEAADRDVPKAILWLDAPGAAAYYNLGESAYPDQILSFVTYPGRSRISY